MYCKSSKYLGFTLIEMLIVMSIIGILMGMSFAAYQNLQTTIRLNEYTNNLEQSIRKVQRDAMLLEKEPLSKWIYGLGIDLTEIEKPETLGQYRAFKWCSHFNDYGDVRTRSIVPNFDPNEDVYELNGNLPVPTINGGGCPNIYDTIDSAPSLRKYILYGDGAVGTGVDTKPPKSTIELGSVTSGIFGGSEGKAVVRYIVFEAVTGRAFFYNSDGYLLNTNKDGTVDPDYKNFVIRIKPLRGGKGKKITIFNISGRVLVEANDE